MHKLLTALSLTAIAIATPVPGWVGQGQGPTGLQTNYEATFEDIPLTASDTLAAVRQIGPYDGLDYKGINVISTGAGGTVVSGVVLHSPAQCADYNSRTQQFEGPPTITTQYPGSVTSTFDFDSFYYGCVLATSETLASLPISCTVTVVGSKASKEVARQAFTFNPGTAAVTAPMVKAQLSSQFKGVDTVSFSTVYSIAGNGATLMDNLKYKTYNIQK